MKYHLRQVWGQNFDCQNPINLICDARRKPKLWTSIVMLNIIFMIRHAEKPEPGKNISGITETGAVCRDELSVRGWQRAGALVPLFAPANHQFQHPLLARPIALFATAPTHKNPSRRPASTLLALSRWLKLPLRLDFARDNEADLAEAALALNGPILISWHHEGLPRLADAFAPQLTPRQWPSDCFDRIWILSRQSESQAWRFADIAQEIATAGEAG